MKKGTVVVLGGGGMQGQSGALDLLRNNAAEKIIAVDARAESLQQLRRRAHGDPRLEVRTVSVQSNGELVALLKDAEVCINGLVFLLNRDIMNACLEAGCHYVDYGGLFHMTRKQLGLHAQFKKAGLTAVLGMGSCPGTINVTARYAVDQLETVSEVHAICGVQAGDEAAAFIPAFQPTYSIRTIMDEYTEPAVIFSQGAYKEVEPASDLRYMTFPDIGGVWCYYILHSEPASYPDSWQEKGIRESSFRLGIKRQTVDKIKLLRNIGFNGKEPLMVEGRSAPSPVVYLEALLAAQRLQDSDSGSAYSSKTSYVVRSHVKGRRDDKDVEIMVDTLIPQCPEWGLNEEELGTGTSAAIAAAMIIRGLVRESGAFAPENIIPPGPYLAELDKRFMPTQQTLTERVSAAGTER